MNATTNSESPMKNKLRNLDGSSVSCNGDTAPSAANPPAPAECPPSIASGDAGSTTSTSPVEGLQSDGPDFNSDVAGGVETAASAGEAGAADPQPEGFGDMSPAAARALREFYDRCVLLEKDRELCLSKRGLTAQTCEWLGFKSAQRL